MLLFLLLQVNFLQLDIDTKLLLNFACHTSRLRRHCDVLDEAFVRQKPRYKKYLLQATKQCLRLVFEFH